MVNILRAVLILFMISSPKDLTNAIILSSAKNRTKDSNFLIYNRIPKCGSTTANGIMRKLSKSNGFRWVGKQIISTEELSDEKSIF